MRYFILPVFVILTLSLTANATTIDGGVTKPDGTAAAGSIVALTNGSQPAIITITGEDGHYKIDDIHDGDYGISAMSVGIGSANQTHISVKKGKVEGNQYIQLLAGVETIRGNLNEKSGGVLKDVKVIAQLQTESSAPIYAIIVNSEYFLTLPPGRYRIAAHSTNFESSNLFVKIPRANLASINIPLFLSNGSNPALAEEIHSMVDADQSARENLIVNGVIDQSKLSEMINVDKKIQSRLHEILMEKNWIWADELGARGEHDLWLLVQHDDSILKKSLPYMIKAANDYELPWADVALSVDRALVSEKKPQIYGSQLSMDNTTHAVKLDPIEDELNVDKRRSELGMENLAEHLDHFK